MTAPVFSTASTAARWTGRSDPVSATVYYCDMLGKFVENADKATSAIVMSGEGDVSRMSPVLKP